MTFSSRSSRAASTPDGRARGRRDRIADRGENMDEILSYVLRHDPSAVSWSGRGVGARSVSTTMTIATAGSDRNKWISLYGTRLRDGASLVVPRALPVSG
jgi:hypothetical protein